MTGGLELKCLSLTNVARFKQIEIIFTPGINVICGTNGVGKTSVLDAAASSVVNYNNGAYIRRRASQESHGSVKIDLLYEGSETSVSGAIRAFEPHERFDGFGMSEAAPYLIYIRPNRDFSYSKRDAVKRDIDISAFAHQNRSYEGLKPDDIKDWFLNRYLMEPHGSEWPQHRKDNLVTAKSLFSILDNSVRLHDVDTSTFDIRVQTPSGIIPFEYLSSGFRSAFSMLLGIMKEIEYRGLQVSAKEFPGVILIDEIDLHLHPTWQGKILDAFRQTFPSAQIIVTTHSAHVVQSAHSQEVIALLIDESGEPYPTRYSPSKYGFAGWTIEEILRDVMGVESTTSKIYEEYVAEFDKAIESENEHDVERYYKELMEMLHPSSSLRKVFALQAASFLPPNDINERIKGLLRD